MHHPDTNANLLTYLQWRGDLSMKQSPLCPVDNLIFCCLSYLNWDGIAEGRTSQEAIPLRRAAALWLQKPPEQQQLRTETDRELLQSAAESDRFSSVRLFRYTAIYSEEQYQQFSAVSFLLEKDTVFAAFRGTDDTLTGWREDFNLSFLPQVPSQETAAAYLRALTEMEFSSIIAGGHSKGGNLAVYAAAMLPQKLLSKIRAVYNNDGPGFSNELLRSEAYLRLQERVHTYVPQASVVGMLLEHDEDYHVVYSTQKGFLQHDPYSWCVMRNDWCYLEEVTTASKLLDSTLKSWILGMTPAERERMTDAIFHVLQSETNARTFQELKNGGANTIAAVLRAWNDTPPETRRFLQKMLAELVMTMHDMMRAERREKSLPEIFAEIQNRREKL